MGQVTETLLAAGQFRVDLKPDTPREILEDLSFYDHLVITTTRVDEDTLGAEDLLFPSSSTFPGPTVYPMQSTLLQVAAYTGVILELPRGESHAVGGHGVSWWLGDSDKAETLLENGVSFNADTLTTVLNNVLPPSLAPGEAEGRAAYSGSHQYQTPKTVLDYITGTVSGEWRVNPDFTVDAGSEAWLYSGESLLYPSSTTYPGSSTYAVGPTPQAMVVPKDFGYDVEWESVKAVSVGHDSDVHDRADRVLLFGEGQGETITLSIAESTDKPYFNRRGQTLTLSKVVSEGSTEGANADTRAAVNLAASSRTRRQISLSVSDYRIDGEAAVGNTIAIFDPDKGLYDLSNEQWYRGRPVWPLNIRVTQASWPVTSGMGVYRLTYDNQVTDLTDYVVFSAGDTTLTVGATPRRLGILDRQAEALQERLNA
jgi:hypothetical protein